MSEQAIEGLKPELLWKYFYEISQVPRPSKKEEKIRQFIKDFASENNFNFIEDIAGNIVIKVPASEGYENSETVILQGHLDMVAEMNKGTQHDFDNDPIRLKRSGGWIEAEGTTLGADNGIGVAAALAIAMDKESIHGPLEILCTVDEETGLTGANSLEPGFVSGKLLLNMDSEEDGVFYVGCAGGIDTVGLFKIKWNTNKNGLKPYNLMIGGLKGGHSGLDISIGRANAIKLLAILLHRLEDIKYRLAAVSGGSKRNAIPREAEATILIDPHDEKKVKKVISVFIKDMLKEYQKNDGGLKVTFERQKGKVQSVFTKKFTRRILNSLLALPHGVLSMNPYIPGLVESSTNLATVTMEDDNIRIGTSQRSSIDTAIRIASQTVQSILYLADASEIIQGDGYPGWQPNMDSALLKKSRDVYKNLFNQEAEVKAIHAGLECGILGAKYPGLDMISFGPTITGAHSPDEKVNIADVEKFYDLLKSLLKNLAT